MEIKVDHEFESRIPPLSEEEFRNLEENILTAGEIYSPIIVWNGTIIDGHNRYRILQKHPELKYSVKEMSFANRSEALNWICWTQLSRRNLSPLQKKYLIGIQYKTQKMSHGGNRKNSFASSDKNDQLKQETTRQRLAREHGVSEAYIQHCADYADGVIAADNFLPGLGKKLTAGEVKLTQGCVERMAKIPEEERPVYIEKAVATAAGSGEKGGKPTCKKVKMKVEPILPDETSIAFQTALEEFVSKWDEILETNEEWRKKYPRFCVYMIGKCVQALERINEDYFDDFFDALD